MQYQRIKYFLAAAECLNFTRAAAKLFISQQSMTKQISLLEQELGVRLFERSTRTVRLTPAGTVCFREFSVIDKEITEAVDKVRRAGHELKDEIAVGFFSSFSADLVIRPIMRKLRAQAPDVDFHVNLYDMFELQEKFFAHELDMCITTTARWRRWKDAAVVQIASEPFYVVVSTAHPLAGKQSISADDLKNEVLFLLHSPGDVSGSDPRNTLPYKRVELLDNFDTLRMRLELGQGFAFLTRVFEGACDERFVYYPAPPGAQLNSEVVCAYSLSSAKPPVPELSRSLSELELHFD